jgi:drug/metabolite transporter (DMT)-like permease
MKKALHFGSITIVVAALLWSVDGLLRTTLYSLPPSVVVFWEHVIGCVVLLPFVAWKWREFRDFTTRQWMSIGLVALLSGALGTILYTAALGSVQFMSFSVVVLLQQLNPVFAIITAAILLKEKLHKRFVILAVVALIGAYMTAFPSLMVNTTVGTGTLIAALYAIGAAAAWGIATAFSKYTLRGTSHIHVTAARFAFTPLFALVIAGLMGVNPHLTSVTATQFWYLVAITFSTGLVALIVYYYGLQRVAASRAAILELAWPLSSVIIGWLLLHQGLTVTQAVGALILTYTTTTLIRTTVDSTT